MGGASGGSGGMGGAGSFTCTETAQSCTCTDVPGSGTATSCAKSYTCCFTFTSGAYKQCQCHPFTGASCDGAAQAVSGTKVAKCPP
ncbi:MAG: hypothetical protein U0263_21615 [Polyangiaceae bacterium]